MKKFDKSPKIDIHCHVTNRKVRNTFYESAFLDTLLNEMDQYNIEKTVLLATYFPHKTSGISNYRLLRWIEKSGSPERFLMFGSLDFEHYFRQGYNELVELSEQKLIQGIKIYTCYQEIDLKSKEFKSIVELAAKHKLPMMFHTGYSYASQRKYGRDTVATPQSAATLKFLAEENPEVTFIFSHMSKPFFHEITEVCSSCPNVLTDMSGLIDSMYDADEKPICVEEIKTFFRKCGPSQLLFGTDFPVQTVSDSVEFIQRAFKDDSITKGYVFKKNAERILRLK
jgi:predicted TIM-barrel fold metal-dependent hydrolase